MQMGSAMALRGEENGLCAVANSKSVANSVLPNEPDN